MLEAGFITAIGVIWLLCRFGARRAAGHALLIDIVSTAVLTWVFIGTYAGMVTGAFAAVIISVFLTFVRKTFGYERLELKRRHGDMFPRFTWVYYPPQRRS